MYTEFKPDEANKLLDGLGLTKKDSEGYRLRADGKRAGFELSVVPAFGPWPDIAQMIAKDLKKVGIKVNVQVRERDLHFQMRQANELQAEIWNQDSAGTMFSGSTKYDIRLPIYGNLTYGPLFKTWYDTGGKEGVEPPQEWKEIVALQDKAKSAAPDEQARDRPADLQAVAAEPVRHRHRRPDRHGPGRRGGQQEPARTCPRT